MDSARIGLHLLQAGWWWSLALLVDTSLYIVLSATYLQNQIGFSDELYYAICWSVIAVCTVVNVLGIKVVAIGSSLFAILIISPILVLALVGLANWQFNPFTPMTPPNTDLLGTDGALVVGLSIGMWFYSGYEAMSTLAGEIEEPQRIIPKALMLTLPFVALMYVLPTLASLAAFGHWELFSVDGKEGTVSFSGYRPCTGSTALSHALLASVILAISLYIWITWRQVRDRCKNWRLTVSCPSVIINKRLGTPVVALLVIAGVNGYLLLAPFRASSSLLMCC